MTGDSSESSAWLEQANGTSIPVEGSCSIGRLPGNQLVIPEELVSRRHALINVQEDGEHLLVDLGSGNGTYLNGRRLVQPMLLKHGDQIEIGSRRFVFRLPGTTANDATDDLSSADVDPDKTIQNIKSSLCWLLIADITNSTQLIKKLADDEMPRITSDWLAQCRHVVERCGGSINKFLGDGFFAYWPHRERTGEQVARALQELSAMQEKASPPFRVVLHFGQVFMGGAASMGEESLLGKEVHFVFRAEKLASSLGERGLVSDAARAHLPEHFQTAEAGAHPVQSFEGNFTFHSFPVTSG